MSSAQNNHWMSPPAYDGRSSPNYHTTLTPYLTLPHLLSLTWLAYPILSLLFVAFRLSLSQASATDAAASAKENLLASCKAAEQAATSTASMPRYLAVASNAQITDAVNGTLNAARATMVLALTVMEAIINFIVDIYRSTFLCFLELVVRGALSILIGAVQEFNGFLSNTFNSIRTSIQSDVASANNVIQDAVNAFNKINPFSDVSIPSISIPSLDALQNVTLPSDFEDALVKLNASLPTIAQLKDTVDDIIDTPFELLKKDINDTFASITFNQSTLPVPEQNTVQFCDSMDTSVVDDLSRDLVRITKIGIILIVVLALLLLAANCVLEWYKWRCLKRHLQYQREAWVTDPSLFHGGSKSAPTVDLSDHNMLMLSANASHPLLTRIANQITHFFKLSPSKHIHLQWFFHYVFHPPALACFLIGFFGLLSVQLQMLAISPLAHKYSEQAAASVDDFSNLIASSVNASMYNQSSAYASDVNGRVDQVQSTINDGLFGWVNTTTTTLNTTINTFYDDIQNAVTTVFNGTVLESPMQEFIRCFIGSKVDAIESALTFLHDNLHVDIPRVNETVLVLSPDDVNEATRPIAVAAIGGGSDDSQGVIGRLVNTYVASLKTERIMFAIFMGLWGIVVLMALCVIFWHSYAREWVEKHKKRKWEREQRGGLDGLVVPFRERGHGLASGGGSFDLRSGGQSGGDDLEKPPPVDLPSFSPMPSPKSQGMFSIRTMQHPLNNRNPAFEKSWDSVLDEASASSPQPVARSKLPFKLSAPKLGSPKKLLVVGRMGRERFVSDQEKEKGSSSAYDGIAEDAKSETQPQQESWLKRMATGWWKKGDSASNIEPFTAERPRPNLTIAVHPPSSTASDRDRDLPQDEIQPSSAWSVSPGLPRKLPWMQNIVPTRKSTLPQPASPSDTPNYFQPKSRRTASVPTDVNSVRDSFNVMAAPPQQQLLPQLQFAVPLHHGFERAVPASIRTPSPPPMLSPVYGETFNNYLSPPPQHPRSHKTFSIPDPFQSNPMNIEFGNGGGESVTPVTRLLTTHHARTSSLAVDPFATPFDDENRVVSPTMGDVSRWSSSVRKSNPFVTMAI